jgi:pSer/pThr/pTyr-binding forkhead associated (FHA) protein
MTRDGQLVVTDLGSTNGTFLNSEATPIATPRVVQPGDAIAFGDVAFRLEEV